MTQMVDRKHGAFYPATTVTNGSYAYNFDYLESTVGRKFDIYSTFIDLGSDYPGNPTPPSTRKQHSDIAAAAAAGHDILIAMATSYKYVQCTDGKYYPVYATGADIQAGMFDSQFTSIFTWLLSLGVNVTVRFMWEANLGPNISAYYPGVTSYASTGTPAVPTSSPLKVMTSSGLSPITSPADYKQTWQYVTTLLRGLPNASSRLKMFYCPGCNDGSAAQAAGNTLSAMLPDPAYVDYIGYDTYNEIGSTWHSALDTLRGPRESDSTNLWAYDLLTSLNSTADVWIGEINCMDQNDSKDTSHTAVGHSKAQWYADLFNLTTELPRLTTINWFDSPGTRMTWPFNSSSAALSAFSAGFNFGPDATQHGVAAPTYTPPAGIPPANPTSVALPFPANHQPGDANRTNWFNAHEYFFNQIAKPDGSGWVALSSNTDGSIPALTLTRESPGVSYVPAISIAHPGGTNYDIIDIKLGTNTHLSYALRDDGRQVWGPGDTADPDVYLLRSSAGLLQITGPGSNPGSLAVTGYLQSNNMLLPDVSSAPSSPGVGGGVQVFAQADVLKVRNSGMTYSLGPPLTAKFSAIVAYNPEDANSTSSALTSGVIYLIRLAVPDTRTLARVGFNIVAGGVSLTAGQCFAGIYDAAGNLLGQTADQAAAWATAGAKNMTPVAVGSLSVNPGYVYAAFLSNGTTGPTISRSLGLGNWLQVGGAGTNYGRYGAGQTSLPTTLTLASITTDADNKFCSIS
ncbi:MAG: hypothetical protein JWM81_297 [Candidatus Saccharibacteria bacterium]|nr:hypothetical protein [Candidatus Saccharibacteria bacterium]